MDTIQAGILNVKMRYIKKWISDRQSAASLYFKNLEGCDDIDVPLTHPDCDHTFHLFVIKTKKEIPWPASSRKMELAQAYIILVLFHY